LAVTDHGKAVQQINELEYVHGEIYANIWFSNRIARISPETGQVRGWIDLAGIIPVVELRSEGAV
jgi:glutamine cyclotransferase